MTKLRALDLFSGIGGLSLALSDYAETVAYCENDRHSQAVLFSRMETNELDTAPIWDDIKTLSAEELNAAGIGNIDLIFGGFPCVDVSVAGRGAGLAGERSGLFFQIIRIARELMPQYIFIENVPGLRRRGLDTVIKELAEISYDCRYTFLSAASLGAPHIRERVFILARKRSPYRTEDGSSFDSKGLASTSTSEFSHDDSGPQNFNLANGSVKGLEKHVTRKEEELSPPFGSGGNGGNSRREQTWSVEPGIRRVAHGVQMRVDRIRRLGNAVVPQCAKQAFESLLGL